MARMGFCRAVAISATLFALPGFAQQAPADLMLERLEPGLWEVRGSGGASLGSICLGDHRLLARLQHRGAACTSEVVESLSRSTTLVYSCRGLGSGRSTIRIETARLVQIDSQGLDRGMPFGLRAEARRTGAC